MATFNVTLLREKFAIQDALTGDMPDKPPLIALSNRMAVPMIAASGKIEERIVIRAQNMHTCARMAAYLTKAYSETGALLTRGRPFDWEGGWLNIISGYEKKWNPARWIAIYHKGRVVFEAAGEGQRHPFLDIIEQCDALNKGAYEDSVKIAEDAFSRAGKTVDIAYDGNIAMVMNVAADEGKVGLILRGHNRTTTFNFTAHAKADRAVKPSQCLSAAAAFLEGIQMTFMVGMVGYKVKNGLLDKKSPEAKQGNEAGQKLGRLKGAVDQFEKLFDVTYRPDRPDMTAMVEAAENFAAKLLDRKKEADGAVPKGQPPKTG